MTTIHFDNTDFTPAILEKCAASRLVELHNTLADKPVARFSDKPTAVKRVWKLLAEYAEQASVEAGDAQKTDVDLEQLGEYGLGDNDMNAECPHCGIDHKSNGWQVHGDEHKCKEMLFECLACGGEWGPKIRRRASADRQPTLKDCRIFVNGGKDAVNPYREGSRSHHAFAYVQANPGTSYKGLQAAGVRMRTITHSVKHGSMRAQQ